jgi:hypothetical protein
MYGAGFKLSIKCVVKYSEASPVPAKTSPSCQILKNSTPFGVTAIFLAGQQRKYPSVAPLPKLTLQRNDEMKRDKKEQNTEGQVIERVLQVCRRGWVRLHSG